MTTIKEFPCFYCEHFIYYPFCDAFPGGIPDSIRLGENDHTKNITGDNGIKFDKVKNTRKK